MDKTACRPADVSFFPDTMPALRLLQQDFLLFIVSNQAGVAEGALTPAEVEEVNNHVVRQLANASARTLKRLDWRPGMKITLVFMKKI